LGTYYTVFPHYRDERIGSSFIHAHNDLIEFPSELGLVGLAPLVLLMLSSFVVAIRLQVSNRSRLLRAMGFASSMAIIAIMLHSTTDFNLQVFANAATFMVILALPFICLNIDRADRGLPETRRSRTLAAGA
jgi:O-antigen ligase